MYEETRILAKKKTIAWHVAFIKKPRAGLISFTTGVLAPDYYLAMGTLERCHGEAFPWTHPRWHHMTYFHTPGPPRVKLKGGPGYEANENTVQ